MSFLPLPQIWRNQVAPPQSPVCRSTTPKLGTAESGAILLLLWRALAAERVGLASMAGQAQPAKNFLIGCRAETCFSGFAKHTIPFPARKTHTAGSAQAGLEYAGSTWEDVERVWWNRGCGGALGWVRGWVGVLLVGAGVVLRPKPQVLEYISPLFVFAMKPSGDCSDERFSLRFPRVLFIVRSSVEGCLRCNGVQRGVSLLDTAHVAFWEVVCGGVGDWGGRGRGGQLGVSAGFIFLGFLVVVFVLLLVLLPPLVPLVLLLRWLHLTLQRRTHVVSSNARSVVIANQASDNETHVGSRFCGGFQVDPLRLCMGGGSRRWGQYNGSPCSFS